MSFIRDAAGVLATNTAAIPLALLTNVLLARALSVEDRGLYALLVAFTALAAVIADLGWSSAIVQRILRAKIAPAQALAAGLAGNVASCGLLLLGCFALSDFTQSFAPAGALAKIDGLLITSNANGIPDSLRAYIEHLTICYRRPVTGATCSPNTGIGSSPAGPSTSISLM